MADRGQQQLVRIAPYNCAWADICSIEVEAIRGAAAPARVFIDHVGSTAVQGLDGKPVIDLLITLMDWSEAEKIARSLAALGYQQESVNRNPPRRRETKRDGWSFSQVVWTNTSLPNSACAFLTSLPSLSAAGRSFEKRPISLVGPRQDTDASLN